MTNVQFSLPEEIMHGLQQLVPSDQHDQFVADAIRQALEQQEQMLYECALAVEQDEALNAELDDWQVTLTDGIWRSTPGAA
ncbi:MAG: hypothetical protein ACJ8CR_05690 [Roseiflexaceae bacterium]